MKAARGCRCKVAPSHQDLQHRSGEERLDVMIKVAEDPCQLIVCYDSIEPTFGTKALYGTPGGFIGRF